jgi:hypothetical protein
MKGIDFTQPVDVVSFGKGRDLWQFQAPGAPQGNWYSFGPDYVPTELGISQYGFNRAAKAASLEDALGLPTGRLSGGGMISVVDDVAARAPRSPVSGNQLFLGASRGLPGGGPEINVAPINTAGGGGIRQIILEVKRP